MAEKTALCLVNQQHINDKNSLVISPFMAPLGIPITEMKGKKNYFPLHCLYTWTLRTCLDLKEEGIIL